MVPPQFAVCAASWDTAISPALYRAHPAPPTTPSGLQGAAQDGNWNAASPLPCTHRQLSAGDHRSILLDVLHRRRTIDHTLALLCAGVNQHFPQFCKKFPCIYLLNTREFFDCFISYFLQHLAPRRLRSTTARMPSSAPISAPVSTSDGKCTNRYSRENASSTASGMAA